MTPQRWGKALCSPAATPTIDYSRHYASRRISPSDWALPKTAACPCIVATRRRPSRVLCSWCTFPPLDADRLSPLHFCILPEWCTHVNFWHPGQVLKVGGRWGTPSGLDSLGHGRKPKLATWLRLTGNFQFIILSTGQKARGVADSIERLLRPGPSP